MNYAQYVAGDPARAPIDMRLPGLRAHYDLRHDGDRAAEILATIRRIGRPCTCMEIAIDAGRAHSWIRSYLRQMQAEGSLTYDARVYRGRICHLWWPIERIRR